MSKPSMFDAEFRARACELAASSKPRVQIAADLGVSDATLYKWMTNSPIVHGTSVGEAFSW